MFPQIDKRQLGLRLKNILKEKNITARDVQNYLSLSCVQTVYRWIEGINVPCIDHLYALSVLMDVSMDYLVSGEQSRDAEEICLRSIFRDGFLYTSDLLSQNTRLQGETVFRPWPPLVFHRNKTGKHSGMRVMGYVKKAEAFYAA